MSFHNNPKYQIPELIQALKDHGLDHNKPSQLSDAFRLGWVAQSRQPIAEGAAPENWRFLLGEDATPAAGAGGSVGAMTVIDIADDDALRFAQRVLESNAPEADRKAARDGLVAIRTRVRKLDTPAPEQATPPSGQGVTDAERLDWLQEQGFAYGFQDMHEGNRWMVDGPFIYVRDAIDAAMKDKP